MYLTGFADEAAADLDGQISATLELGWRNIESRNIDGKNIHNMPDDAFDVAVGKLEAAGVRINCFGSEIANWGKKIADPFDITVEAVKRALAGGKYVSDALADRLVQGVRTGLDSPLHATLSDREDEVMRMIAGGQTVSDIAHQLSLSVKTVSTYRARILAKMGMRTNADLTRYAIENDLVQ